MMLTLEVVNGARSEGASTPLAMTFMEHSGEAQPVLDVQSGGVHAGPDVVTWLQLYGTDMMYALRPLRRGIKHYTFGSALHQDIVLPSPYVSARHGRLVRTPLGLRVVDLKSRNGTYLEGRRKKSFYLEPGQPFVVGARSHRLLALNDEMHAHYRDRELLAVTKQNEILQRKLRVADALIALQKNYRERRSIFRDGLACRPETPVVG